MDLYFTEKENTAFGFFKTRASHTLIIFIHGLGDSHLNYLPFVNEPLLQPYDIFIPDLLGYGKSIRGVFSFEDQTKMLLCQIQKLPIFYESIILVPHSMAGIHAVLLTQQKRLPIRGIYAIETTITQYGAFISEKMYTLKKRKQSIDVWYYKWIEDIYQKGIVHPFFKIYYAGLLLASPHCFISNGLAMRELATEKKENSFTNPIGYAFAQLPIEKKYCMSEKGAQKKSIPFLQEQSIPIDFLKTSSHFCAQENPNSFIEHLSNWLDELN